MKISTTLALVAVLGLAAPAFAQSPADQRPDVSHEIHKEHMEKRAEAKEERKDAKMEKKEEKKKHHHAKKMHHKKHEEKKAEEKAGK